MAAFNLVGRAPQPDKFQRFQRELLALLDHDIALKILPSLLKVALPVVDPMGMPCDVETVFRQAHYITIAGAPGSGRRTALQQIAQRWATAQGAQTPIPALVSLAQLDDQRSRPSVLLEQWLPTSSSQTSKSKRGPLSLLGLGASAPSTPAPAWMLLLHGYDELDAERRAAWRAALIDAPNRWPQTHIAVAVPHTEPIWANYTALTIGSPNVKQLFTWIEDLAPSEYWQELQTLLVPQGERGVLGERLIDVALMAWQCVNGLPETRAELYYQALHDVLHSHLHMPDADASIADLQLLAAYAEPPQMLPEPLVEHLADDRYCFTVAHMRRYLAARQLVEEQRFDLLHQLEQLERDELALQIATLLPDPEPLYATLWRDGHPRPDDVLVLGRCLRERIPEQTNWTLKIAGALVRLMRIGTPEQRSAARSVLQSITAILNGALPDLANAGPEGEESVIRLLSAMSDDLATPFMQHLAYHAEIPEGLAWDLADRLLDMPINGVMMPPMSANGLARWAYVQAVRSPRSRSQLLPVAESAIYALAASQGGEQRIQRASTALIEDPQTPIDVQMLVIKASGLENVPSSQEVLHRALIDQSEDVQRHALEVLEVQETTQVLEVLQQTLGDVTAPWEARVSALNHIAQIDDPIAHEVLLGTTRNERLPLYLRAFAVQVLSHLPLASDFLAEVSGHPYTNALVRAQATQALANLHTEEQDHLDDLIALLYEPTAPSSVAEAVCDVLGELGANHVRGQLVLDTLVRVLHASVHDVSLTLAAIRALGKLGDERAIDPLSELLGAQAANRLLRGSHAQLLQRQIDEVIDAPALPPMMMLRLNTACAEGITPADRPSTLKEFLLSEADLIRAGAAASLAAIGGPHVASILLNELVKGNSEGATDELIATLAVLDPERSPKMLADLIVNPQTSSLTRWLAIRHLADHPQGSEAMQQVLRGDGIDSFTRGAIAEALGQRRDQSAIPLLMQLIDDPQTDNHLRLQALLGLGLIDSLDSESLLMRIACDPSEDDVVRGLAIEHLPSKLSGVSRHAIRELLRRERVPLPIVVGGLRALRRMHDTESLSLMLRYAQDDQAEIAQAALAGLGELGDQSVTPDLVRISQVPTLDRAIRLEATGALLRIDADEFRNLLRCYLEYGALPLRLQALEHLLMSDPAPSELLSLLQNRECPLLLRLRIIERIADTSQSLEVFTNLLGNIQEDLQLRCIAAERIAQARYAKALPLCIELAEREETPANLQLRCINSAASISGTHAWIELGRIAEDPDQHPTLSYWASLALRHMPVPTNLPELQANAEY